MFEKIILDNGIPAVIDTAKEVRSVCIGIWVKVGARNEPTEKNGISHFLEHMCFKGTGKRTARDISVEIDSLGGELNAFTSRESTTFYVNVLDEHMDRALALLTDIFMQSVFPEEEIEKEKRVISEEIKLVEDVPEDYIHDLFNKNIWGKQGLGQSVLGTGKTIETFTRDDLLGYIDKYYSKKNIIVACSGNFNRETLIEKLNLTIGAVRRNSAPDETPGPAFMTGINIIHKKLSETHICLAFKSIPHGSRDRYSMHLLNTILGSGVSSRLFQEIREKRGLAYSIHSFNTSYFDTGAWTVYAATDKTRVSEVVNIIIRQMRGLSGSLIAEELKKVKNQLKGNLILSLESTSSKMINIAKQEMYYGRYFSPEDIISAVESVTLEELKELSLQLVGENPFALTVYGPVKKLENIPV